MTDENRQFTRRVAGVGSTRVVRFVLAMATTFLLSRLLGPAGRGDYALAILVPMTLLALGQLGLPSAFSFFAGRGRAGRSLLRWALGLALGISLVLLLGALLVLPALTATVLRNAPEDLVRIALVSLPFQFVASFCGAVLIGRQTFLAYNTVLVAQSVLALVLVILLVGVADLGPVGAVAGNVVVAVAAAIALAVALRTHTSSTEMAPDLDARELSRFGMRVFPASVTTFFSYRIDVYLLGFLLVGTSNEVAAAIGLYTLAVSLAELSFFVPDAVSTVFFPRVAGAERERADEMAPMVSRTTILVMLIVTVGLLPAAYIAVHVVLPDFTDALPAFAVLIPGVVALGVAKVLSSYVSGLGLPTPVTIAAIVSLAVNAVANVILIPVVGIVGAAIASTISYSVNTLLLVGVASRLSHHRPFAFLIPTGAEVARLRDVVASGLRSATRRGAGSRAGR